MTELSKFDNDPTIYLFTSLTAGSSHIVTATSRIETILRANKIPFKGVDTATDELAKKLFQRRASGKKLPLIVKEGYVLGGITEIEEWNEYDEIREALGVTSAFTPFPAKPGPPPMAVPATTTSSLSSTSAAAKKENVVTPSLETNLALRELGAEAAKKAASLKPVPGNIKTTNPLLAEKTNTPTSTTLKKSPTKETSSSILSPKSVPLPETPKLATPATPTLTQDTKPAASTPKAEAKPATSSTTTKDAKAATPSTSKDTKAKDTKVKDAKAKDSKAKDTKAKTTSSKDAKSKSTRKPTGGLFGLGKAPVKSKSKSSSSKDTKSKDAKSKSTKGTKAAAQPSIPKLSDLQKPVHAPSSMHDDAKNPALGAGPIGSTQEEDSEEEDSEEEEESEEEDDADEPATAAKAPKKTDAKVTVATEESSEEEEDSDEEDEESEQSDEEDSEDAKKPTPLATKGKSALQAKKDEAEESSEEEDSDEEEESSEEDEDEVPKTQKQGAKDASKAGMSVKD
ncbi:hypothetical protein G6011_02280 [Alternaria panax]|uniref:Glutaredoxin domain-containing protein n=1 Tax=Alternaria panax TaxID=48097 RepID=A0AAD4FEI8_9PLEO|nr:hypothetical protein G6011_02280 [Alternaria panax]